MRPPSSYEPVPGEPRQLESLVDDFEEAWQNGHPPAIEQFLFPVRAGASPADDSGRQELLEELVKIDLEYRWRRAGMVPERVHELATQDATRKQASVDGLPRVPRLEDYIARYPELGSLHQLPLELLAEEYRVRRQWGDRPSQEAYAARFPNHDAKLLYEALGRVDAESASEPAQAQQVLAGDASSSEPSPLQPRCPHCNAPLQPLAESKTGEITCHSCGSNILVQARATLHRPGADPAFPHHADSAHGALPLLVGYEVLEVLGRGGMGVVYKARQRSLDRLVALKMILTADHAGSHERARFRSEAEAAARLQHPNIVQIYEVGEQAGAPYFCLEYIEGGTLAQKLAGTPQPARTAAQWTQTLALAMQYAHEHGIVHRDLKPANVLMTADGMPKITDFGLAKRLDKGMGQTQTGVIMGTPSYMATEQAEGKTRDIGPATDVYGLGAILYEMLTGRPPFKGQTPLDTLQQVLYVEPVSPIQLQPKLPRDLQTICLKCLQKSAGDRYASALDLADDLRRFLAGEPILARPTGLWERAVKWARRRPTVAALVLVSSLAVLGLMLGILWHNTQLRAALQTAESERARADGNLQKAREAVDQMLTEVGQKQLAKVPQMEPVRRALLEKALQFYQGFLREKSGDPAVMRETAWAYDRLADIHEKLGRHDDAEQALLGALRLHEQLTEHFPDEPAHRQDRAAILDNLGNLYRSIGRPVQAEQAYQKALAIHEQLVRGYPSVDAYEHDLAMSHLNLGGFYGEKGRTDQAEVYLLKALAAWERLHGDHPEVPNYENQLAKCYTNLGNLYSVTNRAEQAVAAYRKGLVALDHLARTHSDVPECQNALANGQNSLGTVLSAMQRRDEATAAYQKALEIHERLTRDHPGVFRFAVDLGMTYVNMASLVSDRGEPRAALGWYARAIQTLDTLLQQQPNHVAARASLRNAYFGRAEAFTRLARHAEAVADWDRALAADDGSNRDSLRLARAASLARLGEHERATAEAKALAEQPQTSGPTFYDLACVYSLSTAAAREDAKLSSADRDQQAERYASRALDLLAKAAAVGFFKSPATVEHLKQDADLIPISAREDFRKWLAALEVKRN